MTGRGAVQPERVGAVDLDAPDLTVLGETRVDTGGAADGHTGVGEGTLGDRVTLAEGELDPVAHGGGDGVWGEGQARANGDVVHAAGG